MFNDLYFDSLTVSDLYKLQDIFLNGDTSDIQYLFFLFRCLKFISFSRSIDLLKESLNIKEAHEDILNSKDFLLLTHFKYIL